MCNEAEGGDDPGVFGRGDVGQNKGRFCSAPESVSAVGAAAPRNGAQPFTPEEGDQRLSLEVKLCKLPHTHSRVKVKNDEESSFAASRT